MAANASIRRLGTDELDKAGRIIYRAFAHGFRRHGYPEPIPDPRAGAALAAAVYASDPAGAVLLETASRRPIGVGFFQCANDHAFIGPIAIDPEAQGRGHGKRLLAEIMDLTGDLDLRLLQDAFNPISFRLYSRAGFSVREVLALMVTPPGGPAPVPFGWTEPDRSSPEVDEESSRVVRLRNSRPADLELLTRLDREACGVDRSILLTRMAGKMRAAVLDGGDGPRGFACAFPGKGLWVIGPGQAEDGRTCDGTAVRRRFPCVPSRELDGEGRLQPL
jgi:ribosomal protein S18 acetylase RimI-like enzyme